MTATHRLDRLDAQIPTLQPGREYTCPNCRKAKFSLPDVVCVSCQKEPRFKRDVDAFNARQSVRRAKEQAE